MLVLTVLGVPRKIIEDYLLQAIFSDHVDRKLLETELKTFFRADSDNLKR